jgi:hypothetical protein
MRIGKVTLAAAAIAAASAPIAGQAIAADRAAAPVAAENELGDSGIAVAFLLLAIVAGIFLAQGDEPASP